MITKTQKANILFPFTSLIILLTNYCEFLYYSRYFQNDWNNELTFGRHINVFVIATVGVEFYLCCVQCVGSWRGFVINHFVI